MSVRRITVSVDADVAAYIRKRAKERGVAASHVVAEAVRRLSRVERNERIMRERAEDAEHDG
jgi:hypothetical protein